MKKRALRILTIDDDQACLSVIERYFTIVGGHTVDVAENGTEGLKKAAELCPDFILLDMNMPGMSGMEVISGLSADAATRDIPVIIITGAELSPAEHTALAANKNFMQLETKPANLGNLLNTLESASRPNKLQESLHHNTETHPCAF